MILTDKSIAVVLALDDDMPDPYAMLRIWVASCVSYQEGSEIILVDRTENDNRTAEVERFMRDFENSGIKLVYIPRGQGKSKMRLGTAYNRALPYISARYALFANGSTYPNGKVLNEYPHHVDPTKILLGTVSHIKEMYEYSMIVKENTRFSNEYVRIAENFGTPWSLFGGPNFVLPYGVAEIGFSKVAREDYEVPIEMAHRAKVELGIGFEAVPDANLFNITPDTLSRFDRKSIDDSAFLTRKLGVQSAASKS